MLREQIKFKKIKRTQVPFWHPVAKPVSDAKGSQWDEVLEVLFSDPEAAIIVEEPKKKERDRLKYVIRTHRFTLGVPMSRVGTH